MKTSNAPAATTAPSPSRFQDAIPMVILAIATALLFCFFYNRLSGAHWSVPIEYGTDPETSDAKAVLSHVKAAYDGDFVPFLWKNPKLLGAPYTANWNDMPIIEEFLFWIPGVLGHVMGIFAAINFVLMSGYILAALAFFYVARKLSVETFLAFAGALVFAFTRFPFARQIHHLQVAQYWNVPLCLLVTWWAANRELKIGNHRFWIAIAIAAVTGILNPYYTAMFVQLLALAALVALVRKDRDTAIASGAILATAFAGFVAMNLDTFTYKLSHGANTGAMLRKYQWLEFYAMKPLDLIVPPPDHRFPLFANFGESYFKNVLIPGETPPGCYIGLIGIAALAILVTVCVRNAMATPAKPLPLEGWQVLWIGFFSIVGGLNGFIGIFGVQLFRSANRYCIFILAIALLYALRKLSSMKIDAATRTVIACMVIAVALWDQPTPTPSDATIERTAQTVNSDRKFVADLESKLPKGSMIYQFPPMEFPETPIPGLSAYEHFRPYFFAENLRFSFGTMKGRPRDEWQTQLFQNATVPTIISTLERYGFSGFYVNTTPLKDRGEEIRKQFAASGRTEVIESPDHELFCILLKPSPNPVLPGGS